MMRFRDDIDPERTWIWSDTHFGHKNIIGYCHRPDNFEDILLEEINAAVQPGDTILHLGDLCYKGNSWFKNVIAPKIAPQAERKLLILGNHDRQRRSFYGDCGWKIAAPFMLALNYVRGRMFPYPPGTDMRIHEYLWQIVSFSHYPWNDAEHGGRPIPTNHTRIHGHIHNNGYYDGRSATGGADWRLVPFLRNHVNVSCEQTKYKPVNLQLLLEAVLLGVMPGGDKPSDGESPSAADIGKESHHA